MSGGGGLSWGLCPGRLCPGEGDDFVRTVRRKTTERYFGKLSDIQDCLTNVVHQPHVSFIKFLVRNTCPGCIPQSLVSGEVSYQVTLPVVVFPHK